MDVTSSQLTINDIYDSRLRRIADTTNYDLEITPDFRYIIFENYANIMMNTQTGEQRVISAVFVYPRVEDTLITYRDFSQPSRSDQEHPCFWAITPTDLWNRSRPVIHP